MSHVAFAHVQESILYVLSLFCDTVHKFTHISNHFYNSLLETITIFSIEHQAPQGFSPVLPY